MSNIIANVSSGGVIHGAIHSGGTIIANIVGEGPRGLPGDSPTTYIHNQIMANNVWNITHNLNRYPSVTIVDSGGSVVGGDVTYLDANTIRLAFNYEFSGKAYLN